MASLDSIKNSFTDAWAYFDTQHDFGGGRSILSPEEVKDIMSNSQASHDRVLQKLLFNYKALFDSDKSVVDKFLFAEQLKRLMVKQSAPQLHNHIGMGEIVRSRIKNLGSRFEPMVSVFYEHYYQTMYNMLCEDPSKRDPLGRFYLQESYPLLVVGPRGVLHVADTDRKTLKITSVLDRDVIEHTKNEKIVVVSLGVKPVEGEEAGRQSATGVYALESIDEKHRVLKHIMDVVFAKNKNEDVAKKYFMIVDTTEHSLSQLMKKEGSSDLFILDTIASEWDAASRSKSEDLPADVFLDIDRLQQNVNLLDDYADRSLYGLESLSLERDPSRVYTATVNENVVFDSQVPTCVHKLSEMMGGSVKAVHPALRDLIRSKEDVHKFADLKRTGDAFQILITKKLSTSRNDDNTHFVFITKDINAFLKARLMQVPAIYTTFEKSKSEDKNAVFVCFVPEVKVDHFERLKKLTDQAHKLLPHDTLGLLNVERIQQQKMKAVQLLLHFALGIIIDHPVNLPADTIETSIGTPQPLDNPYGMVKEYFTSVYRNLLNEYRITTGPAYVYTYFEHEYKLKHELMVVKVVRLLNTNIRNVPVVEPQNQPFVNDVLEQIHDIVKYAKGLLFTSYIVLVICCWHNIWKDDMEFLRLYPIHTSNIKSVEQYIREHPPAEPYDTSVLFKYIDDMNEAIKFAEAYPYDAVTADVITKKSTSKESYKYREIVSDTEENHDVEHMIFWITNGKIDVDLYFQAISEMWAAVYDAFDMYVIQHQKFKVRLGRRQVPSRIEELKDMIRDKVHEYVINFVNSQFDGVVGHRLSKVALERALLERGDEGMLRTFLDSNKAVVGEKRKRPMDGGMQVDWQEATGEWLRIADMGLGEGEVIEDMEYAVNEYLSSTLSKYIDGFAFPEVFSRNIAITDDKKDTLYASSKRHQYDSKLDVMKLHVYRELQKYPSLKFHVTSSDDLNHQDRVNLATMLNLPLSDSVKFISMTLTTKEEEMGDSVTVLQMALYSDSMKHTLIVMKQNGSEITTYNIPLRAPITRSDYIYKFLDRDIFNKYNTSSDQVINFNETVQILLNDHTFTFEPFTPFEKDKIDCLAALYDNVGFVKESLDFIQKAYAEESSGNKKMKQAIVPTTPSYTAFVPMEQQQGITVGVGGKRRYMTLKEYHDKYFKVYSKLYYKH